MAARLSASFSACFAPLHDHGTTDADLLARYTEFADAAAFTLLVKRHGGMVAAVCRKRLNHAHDAEDAAQAVFLALARNAAKVAGSAPVAAWLYGAASRVCKDVLRRNRRRPWQPLTAEPAGDTVVSPDFEAVAAVLDEVARLPEACRAAVVLCELEGVPRSLAARRLGIAEGTLSSRLVSARKRLADRLDRRGFGPATLAVLSGLVSGVAAPAVSLPSLTLAAPAVVRLTEVIMTTTLAWKAKLAATLTVATLTIGLAAGAGDGPAPQPTVAAKPIAERVESEEPKFRLATVSGSFSIDSDGASFKVGNRNADWAMKMGGVRGPERMLAVKAVEETARREAVSDGIDGELVGVCVTTVGPAGDYLAEACFGQQVEELGPMLPVVNTAYPGHPVVTWQRQWRVSGMHSRLYIVSPAGRVRSVEGQRLLTPSIVWSADGKSLFLTDQVTVTTYFRVNPPAILPKWNWITTRVDVATGVTRRVALPQAARLLAAGSDGKTLLVATKSSEGRDALALATLPADPDAPLVLRDLGITFAGTPVNAAVSPDGTRAIVTDAALQPYAEKGTRQYYPLGIYQSRRLLLVDLATGVTTPLATQPVKSPAFKSEVCWSPDGRRVGYTDITRWVREPGLNNSTTLQPFEPHLVTCDPNGKNPKKLPLDAPAYLVGWR